MTLCFDMDGTIADLYSVDNWLEKLCNYDASPYEQAKPLLNLNSFARIVNRLQREGNKIVIISWLSKHSTDEYNENVTDAKLEWLNKHLHSVHWDEINIVEYGTPKSEFCDEFESILFDDEESNRIEWELNHSIAFHPNEMIEILKAL